MTKFSVLLPTRNGGPYLRPCIASVLGQPEADLELIVADNANTDETSVILAEFAGDRRLRVVRHGTVQSVTDNWMSAFEASRGDYVVMIGDDDCLLPSYFERVSELLTRHNKPDCIVYNGYSYVFPGAVGVDTGSYYADPHFRFDAQLPEGELTVAYRRKVIADMFRFVVRYPLNLQLTMFSRQSVSRVPEPFFRPPFPDHFAINSLLLTAEHVVYCPDKLVVIGVSPKSFGHFIYGGDQAHGMSYLGSSSSFGGKLEGSELLNSMYEWLELLRRAYPAELGGINVDRGAYVRRQVAYWLLQYRQGATSLADVRRRAAKLTPRDWGRLAGTAVDPASWRRLSRLSALIRGDRARSQWPGLQPLPGVSNVGEFITWRGVTDHQRAPAPAQSRPPRLEDSVESKPTVTVCVPTIGRTTLRTTLESLKAQSYSNYEVLILDNAGTQDAQAEISRYMQSETRASVLRSPVRLAMFDNFQRGVDAASGRYLAFFHDDDVYAKDFLTEQVRFLEAHPSVAFAGSNCELIDGDGHSIGSRNLIRKTEAWPGWRYIGALFAVGSNLFPMQSIMFRRAVLDCHTFESSKGVHYSDFVILMRLAEDHDVGLIDQQLIELRTHEDQASRQLDIGESLSLRTMLFNAYYAELLVRWPQRRSDINRLRRRIRSARRSTAIWTWLSADDQRGAVAARAALGNEGADRWLRYGLGIADRVGVARLLRTTRVRTGLRSAVQSLAARIR